MRILVAVGWMFVVLVAAVAEAAAPHGTLLGALFTLVGWGLIPLAVVLYILGTPARRQARRAAAQSLPQPDGGGHAAGAPVTPIREEP
jgi:membrane protein implicated in regulation of membrane protease activity